MKILKLYSKCGCQNNGLIKCQQDFMITYRKPASLKDMLVRAKIAIQEPLPTRVVIDPISANFAKKKKSPNQGESYNTITKGTCQKSNLIYYLESNDAILNM